MDKQFKQIIDDIPDVTDAIKAKDDVLILVSEGNRFEKKVIDDIRVYIFGTEDLYNRIAARNQDSAWIIYWTSSGEPLKGSNAEKIIRKAEEAWGKGPIQPTPEEEAEIWDEIHESIEDVKKTSSGTEAKRLVSKALEKALKGIYRLEAEWQPPEHKRIENLSSVDSELHLLGRKVIRESKPSKKIELLNKFIDRMKEVSPPSRESYEKRGATGDDGGMHTVFKLPFTFLKDLLFGNSFSILRPLYKTFKTFLKPHWKILVTIIGFDLAIGIVSLPIAFIVATGYKSLDKPAVIITCAVLILAVALLMKGLRFLADVYNLSVKEKLWYVYSLRITRHIIGRDDLQNLPSGELEYRVTRDAKRAFNKIFNVSKTAIAALSRIMLIPFLFFILPVYFVVYALIIGSIIGVIYACGSAAIYERTLGVNRLRGQFNGRLIEILSKANSVRVERLKNDAMRRIREKARPLRDQTIGLRTVISAMENGVGFMNTIGMGLLIVLAVFAVQMGTVNPGMILGASVWVGMIISPLKEFFSMGPELQVLLVHSRRLYEVYEAEKKNGTGNTSEKDFPEYSKQLWITDLEYRYSPFEKPIFQGSLKTDIRGLTSIVGPSGAGKTTFLYILNRTLRPDQGRVSIQKTPIHEISKPKWEEKVAIVPQNNFVVEGTVLENLSLGKDKKVSANRAINTLERVKLWNTIQERGGLEFEIDENSNLSGGETKRLCLARALLRDPEILLMDEIIGSLDPELEDDMMKIFREISSARGTKVIYVAHRESAAEEADRSIKIEDNEIELLNGSAP